MKRYNFNALLAVLAAGTALITAEGLIAGQSYAVTDLGTLGGTNSHAYGINNLGEIVGDAMLADGRMHAFIFANGVMMDLGTLGGTNSHAYSCNDLGQIVGGADLTNGMHHGFLATNGPGAFMMGDLGTLGGSNSVAYCINAMDAITGSGDLPAGLPHAFMWTNMARGMMDIDAGDASSSASYGMNGANQVVGYAHFNGAMRAFMTGGGMMGGGMTDMGALGGGASSAANSVNGAGTAVGASMMSDGSQQAFYSSGGMGGMMLHTMGALGGTNSQAFAINAGGMIVGTADTTNGMPHAFMFSGGMMRDLNDIIPTNSGWMLSEARGINDTNQIVGSGLIGGQMHGFLLTPVSSPVQVTSAPSSMTMSPGVTATLTIGMSGTDPLRYQWMWNGMILAGQTNSTLLMTNLQPAQAGNYSVVVKNTMGMVAAQSAALTLVRLEMHPGMHPGLTINGAMGASYRMDFATNLAMPNPWMTITNLSLPTNSYLFMDPRSPRQSMGYYRVVHGP